MAASSSRLVNSANNVLLLSMRSASLANLTLHILLPLVESGVLKRFNYTRFPQERAKALKHPRCRVAVGVTISIKCRATKVVHFTELHYFQNTEVIGA